MLRTLTAVIVNGLLFTGIAEVLLHLIAASGAPSSPFDARSSMLGALAIVPPLSCLALLIFASGLPTLRLASVSLGSLWVSVGAAPLFLVVPEAASIHLLWGGVLLVFVALLLQWLLRLTGRPWLLSSDAFALRARSGRRIAFLGVAGAAALPLLAGGYGIVALLAWVQLATRSFVSFDLAGIDLGDRLYRKEGFEVRLVGMMHVGEGERYRELVKSFVREDTVVLFEGVTDDEGLMGTDLDYGGAASALGLEAQNDLDTYLEEIRGEEVAGISAAEWPVLRHADLDMSDFSAETRSFVSQASQLWAGESLLASLLDYLDWFEREGGADLLGALEEELIDRRNTHLLTQMNEALKEFDRVVIPWGALHLPGIERALLAAGFSETTREQRQLIAWMTLLRGN